MALLRRGITPLLNHLLDVSKVVILEGGRSVGKTTLARQIADEHGFRTTFDLSDPGDRSAIASDPHRVIAASARPILIDEAQLEPEITVAVKRLVDKSPETGQVLLTGSARIGRGALDGSDPLVGRATRLRLNPLTQSELNGHPNKTVESWWTSDPEPAVYNELGLDNLADRFIAGGLPTVAINNSGRTRKDHPDIQRLLSTYVEGVANINLAGTRTDQSRLLQTFQYLSANPGQILNMSRAASELGMRAETVQKYLNLCESSFLLDVVLAHRPTEHQTLTAHPRIFASDVGLAAWAASTSAGALIRNPRLLGALLENLLVNELTAQSAWSETPARLLHWRDTRTKREVDLVLQRNDGSMLAIEIKSASAVSEADAVGLKAFADLAGSQLKRSLIVHTGRAVTQLDENIWAVPISALF